MARLLADENCPLPVVEALRRLGHDVVTLAELGQAQQALHDRSVLDVAAADQRAVVTLNRRHFIRLHADAASHTGIIVCTFDPDFDRQARRIDQMLREVDPRSLSGRLLSVTRGADNPE